MEGVIVVRRTVRQRVNAVPAVVWILIPFVGFLIATLWITLPVGLGSFVSGVNIPVLTDSRNAAALFGGGDSGSLLRAAISIRENTAVLDDQRWVFNVWPPGMVVLNLALLALESVTGIPIVLLMVVFTCVLLSLFPGCVFTLVRAIGGWVPACLFGVGVLVYSGVSDWALDSGLFYSDTFGVIGFGFALLSLVMVGRGATTRGRLVWAALSGVALAGGAYFRASFELVADGTLLLAGIVVVLALLVRWRRRWPRFTHGALVAGVPLIVLGVVAQVVMLPWRIYGGLVNHPGDFRWSVVSDLASVARWLPESVLRENNILFGLYGHSNWACLNDPPQCEKIFALEQTADAPYGASNGGYFTGAQFDQMTLQSFLAHPFTFILERINALGLGFASNTGGAIRQILLPESILLVALFVAVVVVFIRTRAFTDQAYIFFFLATVGQTVPLLLLHQEPRYFLGIEIAIIVMSSLALATACGNHWASPLRTAPAIVEPAEERS